MTSHSPPSASTNAAGASSSSSVTVTSTPARQLRLEARGYDQHRPSQHHSTARPHHTAPSARPRHDQRSCHAHSRSRPESHSSTTRLEHASLRWPPQPARNELEAIEQIDAASRLSFAPARPERPRVRSFTLPTMAESVISIEPSPGSPPELTNSKSSKSSSFHSATFADAGPDIAHFEDITLDDLAFPQEYFHDKQPAMSTSAPVLHKINTHMSHGIRDATARPNFQHNEHHSPLGLPLTQQGRSRKRRPIPPNAFLPNLIANAKRSRSTSPINGYTSSPRSPRSTRSASTSSHEIPSPHAGLPHRRQSWQPGRKSVKELEDEINDLDEELPEDAVIWNVPISPRPPHEREASRSPKRPDSGELSPADSDRGLGIQYPPPGSRSRSPRTLPRSPLTPSLPRSVSMSAIPEDYNLNPRSATKSWDAAMSDLSDEARELTQVLETLAEQKEREDEDKVQQGSPRRRTVSENQTVTLSSIELPPVRKGDIMIDPLPVSKEKEKVLTRTRPSWLPPKNPEEEKRHLREYQKMMAKAQEAEKRKAKKQQQQQCERDDTKESLARVWEQHVLPNWTAVITEPRTRELWWRGITPRDRGTVWQRAIGNDLGLVEASYNAALQRARSAEKRISKLSPEERVKEKEWQWFEAIRRDVTEAFPELKIFQPGGPLHEALLDVLMAYAMYRSDVGYVYGTHVSCFFYRPVDKPLTYCPSSLLVF
jgi:hypothetical protein